MDPLKQATIAAGAVSFSFVLALLVYVDIISLDLGTFACGVIVGWACKMIWDEGKKQ